MFFKGGGVGGAPTSSSSAALSAVDIVGCGQGNGEESIAVTSSTSSSPSTVALISHAHSSPFTGGFQTTLDPLWDIIGSSGSGCNKVNPSSAAPSSSLSATNNAAFSLTTGSNLTSSSALSNGATNMHCPSSSSSHNSVMAHSFSGIGSIGNNLPSPALNSKSSENYPQQISSCSYNSYSRDSGVNLNLCGKKENNKSKCLNIYTYMCSSIKMSICLIILLIFSIY